MGKVITILAGGWSAICLHDVRNKLPGRVIACNDALSFASCDEVVSMDRAWTENHWGLLCEVQKPAWIRQDALKRIKDRPEWLRIFACNVDGHFADYSVPDKAQVVVLNANNTGACAFNLAYLKLRRTGGAIYLVGFDMQPGPKGERHWYPDYDWGGGGKVKSDWSDRFQYGADLCRRHDIQVYNVSDRSLIKSFPVMPYDEFKERCAT